MVQLCREIDPEANKDSVMKKIQNYRGCFRKELKKIEKSKRSGNSADNVYTPNLWYYNYLLFTLDQEIPTTSTSNIDSNPNCDDEELDVLTTDVEDSENSGSQV